MVASSAACSEVLADLIPWQCRCKTTGTAATVENAGLDWLAHHDVDHGGTIAASDLRHAMALA
jgi:hypothetical protein